MVKRDRLLAVLIWLPWVLIVLGFVIWLVVLCSLFFIWPSMNFMLRGGIILGFIVSYLYSFRRTVRTVLKREDTKQWRRVEALRMNPQEAPLYEIQPEANETTLVLPAVLRARLSGAIYLGFMVLWSIVFGAILAVLPVEGASPEMTFYLGVALGGVIIGLTGVLLYQRIEITEQALVVQRGLKRRKIRWEQARLFAVIRVLNGKGVPVQYELSSAHVLLRWNASYPPGFGFVTCPAEKAAYEQLLAGLLAYISTKTGLPLLDLR